MNLAVSRVKYPNQSFDAALEAPENKQLNVFSMSAYNGSASPNDIAIGHSVTDSEIQTASVGNNLVFSSKDPFDMIAIDQGTAEGGTPTFSMEYWNGSVWSALETKYFPDLFTDGIKVILFDAPIDMVPLNDYYSVRLVASAPPTYVFDEIKICKVIAFREGVLSKAELHVEFLDRQLLLQQGEGVVAFYRYEDAANTVETSYQISP